jgi:hypothetical protein
VKAIITYTSTVDDGSTVYRNAVLKQYDAKAATNVVDLLFVAAGSKEKKEEEKRSNYLMNSFMVAEGNE